MNLSSMKEAVKTEETNRVSNQETRINFNKLGRKAKWKRLKKKTKKMSKPYKYRISRKTNLEIRARMN